MDGIIALISLFTFATLINIFLKPKKNYKKNNRRKSTKEQSYEKKNFYRYDTTKKTTSSYNTFYQKSKTSYAEKVKKGQKYEAYVANYFKNQGYIVWEHGKEKGRKDSSIDLIIKKNENIYFVQCKNWETWKINHKEIKATRSDIRDYLKNNKEFWNMIKHYNNKILYVTSKECLTKSAYRYIKENQDIIEYQVVPIT